MKTKNKKNDVSLTEINAQEVQNSEQNLKVIQTAASTLAAQMRFLSEKLSERYEEGDRRADVLDDAILSIDSAISALEKLTKYENETIQLCSNND